jgi:hypothetical protein
LCVAAEREIVRQIDERTFGEGSVSWSCGPWNLSGSTPRREKADYSGARSPSARSSKLLVLDFPFEERDHRTMPHHQRPKPSDRELSTQIVSAIDAGWEPRSRGRPFVFAVSRDGAARRR